MDELIRAVLIGISLCADSFAVSLCSSTASGKIDDKRIIWITLVFATIQAAFFALGWLIAHYFNVFISTKVSNFELIAHLIGFALLLYVSVSMFLEAIRKQDSSLRMDSIKFMFIGAVATSIDALATGASMAMDFLDWEGAKTTSFSIFSFTALSVIAGLSLGGALGSRYGRPAQIAGSIILFMIGVNILL
ncbi:MAG: manganese efflux pump [Bacteroidales bacterium]|nr:manganese efflux pump [Bacteroidales bacterium]